MPSCFQYQSVASTRPHCLSCFYQHHMVYLRGNATEYWASEDLVPVSTALLRPDLPMSTFLVLGLDPQGVMRYSKSWDTYEFASLFQSQTGRISNHLHSDHLRSELSPRRRVRCSEQYRMVQDTADQFADHADSCLALSNQPWRERLVHDVYSSCEGLQPSVCEAELVVAIEARLDLHQEVHEICGAPLPHGSLLTDTASPVIGLHPKTWLFVLGVVLSILAILLFIIDGIRKLASELANPHGSVTTCFRAQRQSGFISRKLSISGVQKIKDLAVGGRHRSLARSMSPGQPRRNAKSSNVDHL